MASDTELFKDKIEISLDGRQVFYLFFGGAVIASLVFVLGVMVGKRVESRSHLERSAATSAALDPLAALDQLSGGSSGQAMSYASSLTGGTAATAAVDRTIADMEKNRVATPPPAPVKAASPAVKADEDEDERDGAGADAADAKAKAAAEKAAAEKAEKAAKEKAAKEAAAKVAAEKAAAEKEAKSRFTLQLSSFQDRGEAEAFLSRMKIAGYAGAVMTEAEVEGKGTYFRIRVGRYSDYEDAVAAKAKFESEQRIIAYVTRL